MTAPWPMAELDAIARLRALAAGLPGVVLEERVIDAPFDEVWGFVADLETSVPAFDDTVSRVRVVRAEGERLRIHSWARGVPVPLPFDVTLRPGWAWMVASPQVYVVGMAAVPTGNRTRFGHLEGPLRGGPPVRRLGRGPLRRHVRGDLDGIERSLAARRRRDGTGPG
ncbi:MAG TPA: hypothetical protein VIL48_12550 [Acidimicrobiales bacterium]